MNWKKKILQLSKMQYGESIDPVMRYPWGCNNFKTQAHKHKGGEICHCDDGYLCEHRAKWLIKYLQTDATSEYKKMQEQRFKFTEYYNNCYHAALIMRDQLFHGVNPMTKAWDPKLYEFLKKLI